VRLEPVVQPGEFVFVSLPIPADLPALATVQEAEGLTHVLYRRDADTYGLAYDFVAGWITLHVRSALDDVGLTAAVSAALADAGISCNVLAGFHHDHLLVPHDRVDDAMAALRALEPSG
jgi:hypothetical protein